jgi:hypothetical protein
MTKFKKSKLVIFIVFPKSTVTSECAYVVPTGLCVLMVIFFTHIKSLTGLMFFQQEARFKNGSACICRHFIPKPTNNN